jgi:hypothetical protein
VGVASKISTILVANTDDKENILIRTSQLHNVHHDLLAEDEYISNLDYKLFIQELEKEVNFKSSRSSIFYYTKILDGWTRVRISTEARWHSALQDTIASKVPRATFVIEPLI